MKHGEALTMPGWFTPALALRAGERFQITTFSPAAAPHGLVSAVLRRGRFATQLWQEPSILTDLVEQASVLAVMQRAIDDEERAQAELRDKERPDAY